MMSVERMIESLARVYIYIYIDSLKNKKMKIIQTE